MQDLAGTPDIMYMLFICVHPCSSVVKIFLPNFVFFVPFVVNSLLKPEVGSASQGRIKPTSGSHIGASPKPRSRNAFLKNPLFLLRIRGDDVGDVGDVAMTTYPVN